MSVKHNRYRNGIKKVPIFFVILLLVTSVTLVFHRPQLSFAANSIIGYLDSVDSNGLVSGWALETNDATVTLTVHIYVDGPAGGQGQLIGVITADTPRPDVNKNTGYAGDHGFSWQAPAQYTTGYRHFYAYAIDPAYGAVANAPNPLLTNSPQTIGTPPNGDAQISATVAGSPLVISTSNRFAGAIDSLTWGGKEFINSHDHGRELQSAASFSNDGECYNPTEAGSNDDGTGATSTSVLQALNANGNVLTTQTQMAFWLRPGEQDPNQGGCGSVPNGVTLNTSNLSPYILNKTVTIGFNGMEHVIAYNTQFTVPNGVSQSSSVFEAVTGYMPAEFSTFWTYDPVSKTLAPLSDGPGEQPLPVIMATPDGQYAMGVYSPDLPQSDFPSVGYARFRFNSSDPNNATVKWNCTFRTGPITGSSDTYHCYIPIGTLQDVEQSMDQLQAYFKP